MTATILVVDDEPDLKDVVLQHFRGQINDRAVAFLFAHDGIEAIQSIQRNPEIDVVLSDINMPRMDGLSLLKELQNTNAKKTTIIVSAYGDMTNIRTAMNRGAFDFLTKPIDFHDLELTIFRTIRHVGTLRESRQRQAEAETAQAEAKRAYASLSRYFSPQIASRLAAHDDPENIAVHRRDIAVIFTDITGFTSLVERIAPDVLGEVLNEYIFGMTEIVFGHGGAVTKIVGDAIQILFNVPGDQADYAARAIACAYGLDKWAEEFRLRLMTRDVDLGVTRIGVHAGPVLVGNFGGGRFFDYTAHGDTMNTAARLEAANKHLGTRICVSADVAELARNFHGRPIGDLILRGRSKPLRAYEALSPSAFERKSLVQYLDAYSKLIAEDIAALPAFAALVGTDANDVLAGYHLRRLLNGHKGARIQVES
jgi:adenylate cyclase